MRYNLPLYYNYCYIFQVVDFSVPFFEESLAVSVKVQDESKLIGPFLPFTPYLWITVFGALFITALPMWLVGYYSKQMKRNEAVGMSFSRSLGYCYRMLVVQGR